MSAKRAMLEEKREWILSRYAEGLGMTAVAAELGVSIPYLARIVPSGRKRGGQWGQKQKRKAPAKQPRAPRASRRSNAITLSDEQQARIRERYAEGKTVVAVAEELGVSTFAIRKYCPPPRRGQGRPGPQAADPEQIAAVKALYAIGWSAIRVQRELGLSTTWQRTHIPAAERPKLMKLDRATILRMWEMSLKGASDNTIAKAFGVTASAVNGALARVSPYGAIMETSYGDRRNDPCYREGIA